MNETGTLRAWYLGLAAIGGPAVLFDLGGIFRLGGSLIAGATWAIDANSGIYESCVFITSEGEVAVYDGAYPGDPAWALKGVYKVSRPLGKRCLMKAGGDLAILTEDGIVPMSKVQTLDQIALQNTAITLPIAPAWRNAVLARKGMTGWQIVLWPLESMGIVNLPKTDQSDKTQFIVNARTGAWARYLGWDAICFAVFNNNLYYGTSDGRVMQAEIGSSDNGLPYTWTMFPSFSDLGSQATRKQIRMARPLFQSNYSILPQITIKVDFDTDIPPYPSNVAALSGPQWGTAVWGIDTWPYPLTTQTNWISAPGFGTVVSPVMQGTFNGSADADIRISAIELLFENGNILG